MNAGRFFSSITTPSRSYQRGNIQTADQIQTAKAVRELENDVQAVADKMFAFDETNADFNNGAPNSVALDGSQKGNVAGVATRSEDGKLTKLDAGNGEYKYSVTVNGDNKKITRTREIDGSAGPLFIEDTAVFNGDSVEYKTHDYTKW